MYIDKINRNIDLDYIKSKLDLCEKDIVFISGSLIENIKGNFSKNIGNIYSDIDIFILKDELKKILMLIMMKAFLKFILEIIMEY